MNKELTPLQEERKKKIILSSIKMFASKGYHLCDIESIASDAGVGKGTVYRYFKDKEELYLKAVSFQIHDAANYIIKKLEDFKGKDFLEEFINAHYDYFKKNDFTYSLIFRDGASVPAKLINAFYDVQKSYEDKIFKALSEKFSKYSLREINLDIAARALSATINVLVYRVLVLKNLSFKELSDTVKTIFYNGICLNYN